MKSIFRPPFASTFAARLAALLAIAVLISIAPASAAERPRSADQITVDALSVVKVKSHAVRNARSASSLGIEREGTGVVIDSRGLVLTIGYLVTEAEKIELSTADGKVFPATVVGYDNETGLGLLKALTPLPIKPVDFGESANVVER